MAKQLNVKIGFDADTRQAKQKIVELQNALMNVAKMPGNSSSLFDDTEIRKASQAALELSQHLQKATNADTGKLDLSRFSSSLKASNRDLQSYVSTLVSVGPNGQQAFMKLAQAIATADAPVTRINNKLKEMGTTLVNTARWQISSSVLHGFMGTIQRAYGYAQDLNKSLNDIRIVTGQNVDQMAKFAETANRAAKSLSATTTEYTNASLIYYQQGLSDEEVQNRTDITIKMANVAGQSVETVSDQMTAVWNNFDDGTKSLEHYADVMTALGAETASSTDEIAQGLEKFAAIGETIGLSYEYAASALATITSNTRQSADVVGTALKTIFARVQGLSLGDTLEDGVTLNKYSEALDKVGISIFDQAGELKKMDNILNEMGKKWQTLSKGQQTALAQTVAGVRQYTQLMSLMNEWDSGDNDSMMANLEISYNSSGALQEQQDIYAESWEAAQERVTAAAENIYDSLINDEGFINLLNGIEKVLQGVGGLIDGLGGLKGIILTIGSVFTTIFAQKMPDALSNLRQNIMVVTGQSNKVMTEMQEKMKGILTTQIAKSNMGEEYDVQARGLMKITEMKQKLTLSSKNLSASEKAEYEQKIQLVELMYKEIAALVKKKNEAVKAAEASKEIASKTATASSTKVIADYDKAESKVTTMQNHAPVEPDWEYAVALEEAEIKANGLKQTITEIGQAANLSSQEVQALMGVNTNETVLAEAQEKIAEAAKKVSGEFSEQIKKRADLEGLGTSIRTQASAWEDVSEAVTEAIKNGGRTKDINKTVETTKQKMQSYLSVIQKIAKENGIKIHGNAINNLSEKIEKMDADSIEKVTGKFSTFAKTVSDKVDVAIDDLDVSIKELRGTMSSLQFDDGEIDQLEQDATDAANSTRILNDALDNTDGVADEPVEKTFKLSTALTQAASVAMSVSSLITGIQSAASVFADDSATGIEKLGAALSIVMPVMATFNALMELSKTLSEKDKIAKFGQALGEGALALVTKAVTIAKGAETAAVVANSAAWLTNPVGWIAAVIVGLIAVLGALVATIVGVTSAIDSNTLSTKEALENVEKAKENYQNVKSSLDDLKSSLDDIKNIEDPFKELVKGTAEWNLALVEANTKVMDLVNKYPELLAYMKESSTVPGLKIISEDGIEAVLEKQTDALRNAQSNVYSSEIIAAETVNKDLGERYNDDLYHNLLGNEAQIVIEAVAEGQSIEEAVKTLQEANAYWSAQDTSGLIDSLKLNETSLMAAAAEYASNSAKIEANTAALIDNTNAKNDKYNNSKYKDFIQATNISERKTEAEKEINGKTNDEIWDEYEKYLEKTTGKKTKITGRTGKATVEQEVAPGVYEVVGKKNSLEISGVKETLATEKAATFTDQEIADIEAKAEKYVEDARKLTVDGKGLSEDVIQKIALAFYKAEQEGTTVDIANFVDSGTIDFGQVSSNTKGLIGTAGGSSFSEKQNYSPEQSQLINDVESVGLGVDEVAVYKEALGELKALENELVASEQTLANVENYSPEKLAQAQAEVQAKKDAVNVIKESIAAQEAELEIMAEAGKAAAAYGLNKEELSIQAKQMAKAYGLDAKAAAKLAVENQRMNKGVVELADNWEDWRKELKAGDKTTQDWAKAALDCTKAIADLVGASEDLELPSDFFDSAENLRLIDQAAKGSEEAINKLGLAVASAQVKMMDYNSAMYGKSMDDFISVEDFEGWKATVMSGIDALQNSLDGVGMGDDVYEQLGGDDWVTALNEMAMATGMTVDQMNELLNEMGVETDVTTTVKDVTTQVPWYRTQETITPNPDGTFTKESHVTEQGLEPIEGQVEVAQINTGDDVGTPPKINFIGNGKVSQTSKAAGNKGGGGGSKPKKTSEARGKKTDIVDRYKEINDQLEETTRLMSKNSILAEGLWGPARFKKLKENIKLMEWENKQLKDKYELSKLYLKEDADALLKAGQAAGINFNIDSETGLITNYTNVMTQLYKEREALLNSFGETMDEAEEERLAEFDKKVDAIKESYKQYETTLDEKKDAEEEHLQKILDIQTAYYDLLNEELEVNLSVNEKDLEILEYYLNKFSDDFYHMAEAATFMVGDFANGKMGGQIADYFSNIDMYQNNMEQMEKDHSTINPETGATYINDEQYVKALGDTLSNVLGELSNIINIDKQMLNYYADALAAAGEEVTKYTDRIEHLNGVLDHYRNIMSLMGKEKDYKKMGIVIAGQVKVAEDQMNAAKATYEMYVGQQQDIYAKWQAAIASRNNEAAELFKKEYYAITETVEEAQNNFLSSTEATLEAYKAQLENDLAEIGEILENSLTGGKGFDWINSTMERMNSLHEEYLTTTNKIYETNKMMNQTQQEIDKTSNTVAKRKLKDFINQTKSLQEQTALSKFELDIQQAKYDLLLAEIALEEAQNAKSQVRLQRDSEGNFGYVYTADTSAVDDAQQKYEDAQNNLYNISLEGANKYAEQRNQLTQEFYDTMRELEQQWLDGSFASEEEYRAAQEEAQTYYYERLRQASELYNVAIGADASAAAEHILGQENLVYNESFTSFAGIAREWKRINKEMMDDSLGWKTQVCEYVNGVISSFNLWDQRCAEIEEKTHLDNLAKEVENITKKSEGLVDELTKEGGVIDSVEEQLDKVQKVTEAYALQRKEIQGLIKDLEKYIKTLQDKYKAETQPEEEPEEEKPEDNPTENNNSDTAAAATALAQEARELVTAVHTGTIKNGVNGWIPSARSAGYSEKAISIALKAINESKTGAGYGYYYDKALALIDSYDTGGYTGEWDGSYGKLAMVHQKELILNENDTANFLAGMEIFRQIISTIDLQSANMAYLGNINSPTLGALQDGTLEQNVHIEASFPNVTDSNQIEEAFKDIVNLASQYANRK